MPDFGPGVPTVDLRRGSPLAQPEHGRDKDQGHDMETDQQVEIGDIEDLPFERRSPPIEPAETGHVQQVHECPAGIESRNNPKDELTDPRRHGRHS